MPLCHPLPAPAPLVPTVVKPSCLCPGAWHLLATVVEITAEAGVAPDARRAESTAEVRAVHLGAHNSKEMGWHWVGGRTLWDQHYELVTDGDGKDGCEMNTPTQEREGAGHGAGQPVPDLSHGVAGVHPASATALSALSLKGGDAEEEGWMEGQTEGQMAAGNEGRWGRGVRG